MSGIKEPYITSTYKSDNLVSYYILHGPWKLR